METEGGQKKILLMVAVGVVGIIIGVAGGYFYGSAVGTKRGIVQGVEQGRTQLLAEQEEALQAEIQKTANPYAQAKDAANPFKDAYTNPFAQ